ncbi:tRNA (adenosine(37)-N6)-threonylcarbamoyltransferase complex ATPase subunit type 1 TsaE [Pelotomaculum schinkii]|uniref:tRNA (adenosine(37)-N6)-threonylcarbamoyltransferase complex ATPase subunit type 1 TsaE n=1 Tax=Pelotomaculum schinkii TaxID=78350 RepID=UPI003D0505E6
MKRLFYTNTKSPEETARIGMMLGSFLTAGDIVCLQGELGAGKTCFAQGVARGMGIEDPVTSPTFNLVNEYHGKLTLYHLDVYRLNGPGDLDDLGYEDIFYGDGVTLIEWAERVREALPAERLEILINRGTQDEFREIRMLPRGDRYRLVVEGLMSVVCSGS